MNETRLIELETKITHQDRLIEELNKVVSRQEVSLYQLEERVAALIKLIRDLKEKQTEIGKADEKPPHY